MQSLTLFYLFPAIAFLIVGAIWLVNRAPGILGWIPVASCYAACGVILFLGGCHQMAHVKLTGVEIDLGTPESPREVIIGGAPDDPLLKQAPALEIPGYPYDAFRLRLQGDRLRLLPGSGYDSSIAVQSGENIIPITESGPRLYHLSHGDQIQIGAQSAVTRWTLGKGSSQLTPSSGQTPRWIGQNGTGSAFTSLLPASSLSIATDPADRSQLIIRKGPGFPSNANVKLDGKTLPADQGKWTGTYAEGSTVLEVGIPDALAGVSTVELGLTSASLKWKSSQSENPKGLVQHTSLPENKVITMGGGVDDQIRVFGLPTNCFELTLNPNGKLLLTLSKSTGEDIESGEGLYVDHRIPESFLKYRNGVIIEPSRQWQLGDPGSPNGGLLNYEVKTNTASASAPVQVAAEVSGDLPPPRPPSGRMAHIMWLGNPITAWSLPNRQVTLPMLPDRPFSLFTRRNWRQAAYPLKRVSPYPSLISSSLFSGLQNKEINSLSFLKTDPGITLFRAGKPLAAANEELPTGLLEPNAEVTFLQLSLLGVGHTTSATERAFSDINRLSTRDKFASFRLETRPVGNRSRQVLKVNFLKPEVQSIPMGQIKRGKKIAEATDRSVSFGVNEVSGFSTEAYQVRFKALTSWFRNANAKITLDSEIIAQDDYRTKEVPYESEFTVGERDRLHLDITKRTIPFRTLFWLLTGGAISMLMAFRYRQSLAWNALLFGVAFLTCSRLLFSQAAMVNAPYSFEAQSTATFAIVFVPAVLALLAGFLSFFLPGRLSLFLDQLKEGTQFRWLIAAAFAIFLIRLAFLAMGFKESVNLGVGRFALSILAVPAHIIIFALGCTRLFSERKQSGVFDLLLIGRFFVFTAALFLFQFATAFLVSDVGLFLYMIPQVLIVSLIGCSIFAESLAKIRNPVEDRTEIASRSVMAILLVFPLIAMIWTFSSPKALYSVPLLSSVLATGDEIATGSTELRILQFIDETYLMKLGTDTAERIAQDHAIMENYARRGLWGKGYLQVDVIHAKRNTALNDNVSAVYIFAQFGVFGALAVMVAYLAVLFSSSEVAKQLKGPVGWAAVTAGLTFCLASIYMMAANYGFLPFTGRNMYLLGLNSKSDLIESIGILSLIVLGLSCLDFQTKSEKA